ncbi:MAG: ATP-binding protein [Acidobacteria bacterium]|nr:ATP-binding protein [Acidobacteriota bacterium]
MPTTIESKFALSVPSSTKNLALVRDFVNKVAAQAGFGETELIKLELAIDEACTNVIKHAYGYDTTREVTIRAIFDDEELRLQVIDNGLGFDPDAVREEDLKQLIVDRRSGGLGMQLMKLLMDDVHYEISPGQKNELVMIKKIPKK